MRTRAQIEAEARLLEQRGRQLWAENRTTGTDIVRLFNFPDTVVTYQSPDGSGVPGTHRILRWIRVVLDTEGPEYRLMDKESVTDPEGRLIKAWGATEVDEADNVLEVLETGYEWIDKDHFRERLDPLLVRMARGALGEKETEEAIAEIEAATAELDLTLPARMRVRADAVLFLKGQIEEADFIARTVSRQQWYVSDVSMTESQQRIERIDLS